MAMKLLLVLIAVVSTFIACECSSWQWHNYFKQIGQAQPRDVTDRYRQVKPVNNPRNYRCSHSKYWKPSPLLEPVDQLIIHGKDAEQNEFPYQVALFNSLGYVCGGSVLSEKWLITTGRCCLLGPNRIQFASSDLNDPAAITKVITKENLHLHPRYNPNAHNFDFCLIRLDEPIHSSDMRIQTVCLPASCEDTCKPGQWALTTGWGYSFAERPTVRLQKVDLYRISDEECKSTHSAYFRPEAMVCASNDTSVGTCFGDAGSPLVCYKNGYFSLDGLTLWRYKPCAAPVTPSVFARVCAVLDWIRDWINED